MTQVKLKEGTFDKLLIIWSLCLIVHYREQDRKLSKHNIVADFNEYTYEMWEAACDLAIHHRLLTTKMELTMKGLAVVEHWQEITQAIYQ
jgi:hypothetical protein